MEVTTIGIDLAKSVLALSCADGHGRVVLRRALRRGQMLQFMRQLQPCVVGMEACGGAHHWARALTKLGHQVWLMSPVLVALYRKGNRHDRNDADAVLEAVSRPDHAVCAGQDAGNEFLSGRLSDIQTRAAQERVVGVARSR